MLDNIKILLGDAAANYTEEQIAAYYEQAKQEAALYCNCPIDEDLERIAAQMAIVKLNRINTEGINTQSFNGVNEAYIDGYPANIMALLKAKRKVKLL